MRIGSGQGLGEYQSSGIGNCYNTGGSWLILRRVNAVAPGPVDTPQFKKECAVNPDQFWLDAQAT